MVTPRPRMTSRCAFRFQDWTYALSKSWSTVCGASPAAAAAASAFSKWRLVPPVVTVRGVASGGFALVGVTTFVTGWSTSTAYAPRRLVLPLPHGSQAKPKRGWKFLLLVW